jgi:hypothetical protein
LAPSEPPRIEYRKRLRTAAEPIRLDRVRARWAAALAAIALAVAGVLVFFLVGTGDEPRPRPRPPAEAPREIAVPGVRVVEHAEALVATNEQGAWTVRKACLGPWRRGGGGNETVGPGYVSRLVTPTGEVVVDDAGPPASLNDPGYGGLGAFAWHHARGQPRALRLDRQNAWEVSGRICAEDNDGFGVSSARLLEPPNAGVDEAGEPYMSFAVDVELSDRWTHPLPLMRVRYRYRVYRTAIKSWVAVTQLCPSGRCGSTLERAFVKEPKLAVGLRDERALPYARVATFDDDGVARCLWVSGGPPVGPVLRTGQCAHPARTRVRFDAGTAQGDAEGGCGRVLCLEAVVRAYPAENEDVVPGGEGAPWAGAGNGFDAWAEAADARPAALDRDTPSIDGVEWSCHGGRPTGELVRRWETIARLGEDGRHRALAVLFPAWEGGRGGYDCEPLLRTFGPAGETWGVFLSFTLADSGA